jgi:hypothetical protein
MMYLALLWCRKENAHSQEVCMPDPCRHPRVAMNSSYNAAEEQGISIGARARAADEQGAGSSLFLE